MRFLLLNQYYPPDIAPTGAMLHVVARELARRGHDLHVICSRHSYDRHFRFPTRQTLDGVLIRRLPVFGFGRASHSGRLADYISYYLQTAFRSLPELPRPDLVFAMTTPPFIGLLGRLLARAWGCPHAHWIMDLYPDVMAAHAMTSTRSLLFRLLERLTRWELAGSRLTLSLGPYMAARVARHGGGHQFVPLWAPEGIGPAPDPASVSLRRERGWKADDLVLLYSGNMGLAHRFGEFLAAAERLGPSGPRWAFAGSGQRRGEIEAFRAGHPSARIELHPYASNERLGEHLASANVHLASLDAAWQGLLVPSKIQGIFAAGRPVIFVGPRDNEVADWIEEAGAGWVVKEDDVEGLLLAVQASRNPAERLSRGRAAARFAAEHFQAGRNAGRIATMLEEAAGAAARSAKDSSGRSEAPAAPGGPS